MNALERARLRWFGKQLSGCTGFIELPDGCGRILDMAVYQSVLIVLTEGGAFYLDDDHFEPVEFQKDYA